MAKKESPLMQELGPKKYYERIDKANKFYDTYKAGKTDPKTGEYYNPINFSDPTKPKLHISNRVGDMTIDNIKCEDPNCNGSVTISAARKCSTCFLCGRVHIRPGEDS